MSKFNLGLVINPVAGIGGSVALKGSDNVVEQAIALGAQPKANSRAKLALEVLLPYKDRIVIYTASGDMGEYCAKALGFETYVLYQSAQLIDKKNANKKINYAHTSAEDTEQAIKLLLAQKLDLLLFAGGDGTARNVAHVVENYQNPTTSSNMKPPVLGIPAGCKIHSGVYAVTPTAAGRVAEMMLTKELVTLTEADVMDIDENLFRQGVVKAKRYGEMQIPSELRYVQATKSGGKELDELVLQDIAEHIIDNMEDELYVIGSGSTTAFLMEELSLENTLLGVDLVNQRQLIASDVTEMLLWQQLQQAKAKNQQVKLVITLIGGQGHIFGRGNQQLSPRIIRLFLNEAGGKENILIIATKSKLSALNNRPLIADTGDAQLDQELAGYMPITTGYNDQVLYPVASPV